MEHYGYYSPKELYRYIAFEGHITHFKNKPVGDFEALEYCQVHNVDGNLSIPDKRDLVPGLDLQPGFKPFKNLAQSLQDKIRWIKTYMSEDQPNDYYNQFDHVEVRPKNRREKSIRQVRDLQEKGFLRSISDPQLSRLHYDDQDASTQTEFRGGHWPRGFDEEDSWPYYRRIDDRTPVYYFDNSNKRQRTEEDSEESFCCEHQAQARYQAREARRLSLLQDATERAEEAEQVIDNGHSDAKPQDVEIITI